MILFTNTTLSLCCPVLHSVVIADFLVFFLAAVSGCWYCAACNDSLVFFADCADADACWLVAWAEGGRMWSGGGGTGQGLSSLNSDHFDQTHRRLDEDAYDDVDIRRTAETARFKDMMTLTQCQDHILYMVCMV